MTRVLKHVRSNLVAYLALFVALGGASYAAVSLPAGSVGARQLKDRAITAAKLNPGSVAASIRAWANLTWASGWRVQASSRDIRVATDALGETVTWRHTRFANNCMAAVTPQRNFGPGGPGGTGTLDGYVSTFFNPHGGVLQIDGLSSDGQTRQAQGVTILIVCPTTGSEKVSR
jgi:hypothetical protein